MVFLLFFLHAVDHEITHSLPGERYTFPRQPDWIGESNQTNAYFGISVSTAGDVNGDGFSDIIVGAYRYENGQSEEGRAFVYHGSASGLDTIPAWTAESDQAVAHFGIWVACAGDVNGDGFSDVIVGANQYTNDELNEGRAYAYYGSDSGLSLSPDWFAESNDAHAHFGDCVAGAGDVNGDGFSDVIVGAPFYGTLDEGRAYVYFGGSSGLSPTPDWAISSNQTSSRFGNVVASAGDVDGDGFDDVLVAAYYYDNGQNDEGCVFVFHGDSTGLSVTPDWIGESDQSGARYGISAASAGDVNNDGCADVIVGARHYDNGEPDEGRAFVYHGSPAGLSSNPDWIAESNQAGAYFGRSVATAGDVNSDGYSDVIIGAQTYDNGENDEGRAFVYCGSITGLDTIPIWTAESNQEAAYFSRSVYAAGNVNGDDFSDVIVGAYYYDNGQMNEGRACVYHGDLANTGETSAPAKGRSHHFPTVVAGPLTLPKGQSCKIFDITGREVKLHHVEPGIYFIQADGLIIGKIIKIK